MTSFRFLPSCIIVGLSMLGLSTTEPLLAADGRKPAPGSEEGVELCVLSFNIRYGTARDGPNRWENRRDLVVQVLEDHSPDVVGLQEALRFQIDEIRKALPEYGEVGVGREDGDRKGEYSPVLYRRKRFRVAEEGTFWFSRTPDVPGSRHWGNSIPRICSWARLVEKSSGLAFYIYNVHLDHQSQPSREKSVRLLRRRIAARTGPEAFVVTGDFNAGEDNPAIREMKGQSGASVESGDGAALLPGLVDTFRVLHPDAGDTGTFNGFEGRRNGSKIDYIFVPEWVKTLEARILHDNEEGRYPSDHFPMLARIRVPRVRQS